MEQNADVIIAGGGLNGCTLALACAGSGFRVTLIDREPAAAMAEPAFDGRCYAIALGSQRLFSAIGIWDAIAPESQPILSVTASDGRAGDRPSPWRLRFDHAEIEEGPMGFMVEDRHLRRILLAAVAAQPLIAHRTGADIVAQQMAAGVTAAAGTGIAVTLASGETVTGRLLVGCDGRAGATARRAGIGRTGWDYAQTSLVCAIAHDRPHHGAAHQLFLPPGPVAILPLTGHRSAVVWTESRRQAAAIHAMDDAAYLGILRARIGNYLGRVTLAGARHAYPLSLSLAAALTAPRVALAGDAAHGLHPIAGQGLNLGLRDVATLTEVVTLARRRGEDIGSAAVLARYAQWRQFDRAALAVATDGFNRLFSNDNPVLRVMRDAALGAVNAMPGLRRAFIREAAGLAGDQPKLMTGRAI